MKTSMTVTINIAAGEMAYFEIQFNKADFMAVVDAVGDLTLENIQTNPLWVII